jgi:hypothetical protein
MFFHGMVSQVPTVIYVASLTSTRRVRTEVGTFSIHRLSPRFFGGFETVEETGARVATPEKALLDARSPSDDGGPAARPDSHLAGPADRRLAAVTPCWPILSVGPVDRRQRERLGTSRAIPGSEFFDRRRRKAREKLEVGIEIHRLVSAKAAERGDIFCRRRQVALEVEPVSSFDGFHRSP